MGLVWPAQVADGNPVNAASVNNPINTIANEFNGNIDNSNVKTGAAIDAAKIAGGVSGQFGAWSTWTPNWANLTIGNATVTARYIKIGKTVHGFIKVVFGSTSVMGSAPTFTAPETAATGYGTGGYNVIGSGYAEDVGTAAENCFFALNASTSAIALLTMNTAGTYGNLVPFGASVPNGTGWTTSDYFNGTFTYEAA